MPPILCSKLDHYLMADFSKALVLLDDLVGEGKCLTAIRQKLVAAG